MSTIIKPGAVPARFAHLSVTVTDLEAARAFYGGLLGLPEVPRPDFPGIPGIWYGIGGNLQLHIIVNQDLRRTAQERATFEIRYPHFALYTEDTDAVAEALTQRGAQVNELPASPTGLRQLFVKDPDGNMIEFIGPSRAAAA